jgi:CBS domain containing-hemolysin-like protein
MRQLLVKLFNQLLVVNEVVLCNLELLRSDLFAFLCFGQLFPKVLVLRHFFLLLRYFLFVTQLLDGLGKGME